MIFANILLQLTMPNADGTMSADSLQMLQNQGATADGLSFWQMALNGGWLIWLCFPSSPSTSLPNDTW